MAEASLPRVPRGHEPATPLFPSTRNLPQHDAKAVSPSYARKLASDSATALQNQLLPFSNAVYLEDVDPDHLLAQRQITTNTKADIVTTG